MKSAVRTLSKWGTETVTYDNKTEDYKRQLLEGAEELCALFKERYGIDLFVAYGVLLGFTRAGDFIGHDDDFDLAYISPLQDKQEIYRQSIEIVEDLVALGYRVKLNSYGQYKVMKRVHGETLKFEVFVGWTEADRAFLYFAIDKGVEASAFLPVGRREFHGVSLPVPADPERVNEAIYGPDWRTPDPGFTYKLDGAKWKPFLFLRATPNLGYWNDYYARKKPDEPWSLLPSQFAAYVANETPPGRMLEVGCGNGRDALFFASAGYKVQGVDYCEAAIGICRDRAQTMGLKARFDTLNLCDVAQVLTFAARHGDAYDAVYARFFVHAITELGEAELFKLCAAVLRPGGKAYLEFRTIEDERASAGRQLSAREREDGHYRRFIDVDQFVQRAASHGLRTAYRVAGHGMAAFRGEDPHVARVVLERPGDEPAGSD